MEEVTMMKTVFCLLAFTACLVSSGNVGEVEKAFIDNQLDQNIIKAVPKNKLEVFYEKTKLIVNLGNELAPKNVRDAPQVIYESDPQAFYTLSMLDPDVPSRSSSNRTEWSHWLVVNIPGSDLTKGEVLDEYIGPTPLKDTGLHRYVFLLFKQPEKIIFKEPKHSKTEGKRGNFSIMAFVEKYQIADVDAGNFFQAKFDDSVVELYKQFTDL